MLKETSIKRYIVERTNKAEIRSEEQSEEADLVGLFVSALSPVNHKDYIRAGGNFQKEIYN